MISMKKNHELFWILEVLLLTPVAFFWIGVISVMVNGSNTLLNAVLGQPMNLSRALLITIVCPAAALWFAHRYMVENQRSKDSAHGIAKVIILISIVSIVLVTFYLY